MSSRVFGVLRYKSIAKNQDAPFSRPFRATENDAQKALQTVSVHIRCLSSRKGWLTEENRSAIFILFKSERLEASPLESISNARIFDILAKSQKHYGKQLEPICKEWKLTRNEMDVLLFLHNNPWFDRAADIVSRRGIAKSHVSLSVKNLEHRGLLERRFEPADRRTVHLVLTDQGRAIAGEGCQAQRRFFTALYAGITEEEFAQWKHTVQKICGNIDKMEISE